MLPRRPEALTRVQPPPPRPPPPYAHAWARAATTPPTTRPARSQALDRCEEIDRLVEWNDLQMKTTEFLSVFLEATAELKNVKMAIVSLKHQVAVARSVAQGRARRRDPHFGQTFVHFNEPPPTE